MGRLVRGIGNLAATRGELMGDFLYRYVRDVIAVGAESGARGLLRHTIASRDTFTRHAIDLKALEFALSQVFLTARKCDYCDSDSGSVPQAYVEDRGFFRRAGTCWFGARRAGQQGVW